MTLLRKHFTDFYLMYRNMMVVSTVIFSIILISGCVKHIIRALQGKSNELSIFEFLCTFVLPVFLQFCSLIFGFIRSKQLKRDSSIKSGDNRNMLSYKSSAYFEEFEAHSSNPSFRQSYFDPPLLESVVSNNDSLLNPNMKKSGVNNNQQNMLQQWQNERISGGFTLMVVNSD